VIKEFDFPYVIVDEATQSVEPQVLTAVMHQCEHVVLVGDHRQLGPVVQNSDCAIAGLSRSIFNRFVEIGVKTAMLQVQYRMHPAIAEFPSMKFYDGLIQNGVTEADRSPPPGVFPFPSKTAPMVFIDVPGHEESESGTSFANPEEADMVRVVVMKLVQNGVPFGHIGVITLYAGQPRYLKEMFFDMIRDKTIKREDLTDLRIATIESFQGSERDCMIMPCVRLRKGS
jgi:regulator of nonsense transcripts 1